MTWKQEQAVHFRRIRTDTIYRMMERMHQIEIDLEPGIWPIPEAPQVMEIHWSTPKELRAEITHLRNEIKQRTYHSKKKYKSYE